MRNLKCWFIIGFLFILISLTQQSSFVHPQDVFLSNVEALVLGESYQGCEAAKEVVTGQKFMVSAYIGLGPFGGVSIGDILKEEDLPFIGVKFSGAFVDAYGVICYPDAGTACCSSQGWRVCPEGVCPEVGVWTQ